MSVYEDILIAIEGIIRTLDLRFNSNSLPVVRMKLPKAEEALDTLPLIAVCPKNEPERVDLAGEELVFVTYAIQVVTIAAGNRDFVSNMGVYLEWRQKLRLQFQGSRLSSVPAVFQITMIPEVPIDRALVNQNYDYLGLTIRVRAKESQR